ncbi:MAG TPA: 4a-hydroxytetrahydrobiopterin dehydratase [archaeon]|nr:4a-hydroxytetrahydrobiopterin dehydratase [archaeon]HLD80597.1 4a-hydroxytetrahydrobiopterin dehydratase [archaeon]
MSEVVEKLKEFPGWELKGNKIVRVFETKNFGESAKFVEEVARIAHRFYHYPDVEVRNQTRVTIESTTTQGSSSEPTEKDFRLAEAISRAFDNLKSAQMRKEQRRVY